MGLNMTQRNLVYRCSSVQIAHQKQCRLSFQAGKGRNKLLKPLVTIQPPNKAKCKRTTPPMLKRQACIWLKILDINSCNIAITNHSQGFGGNPVSPQVCRNPFALRDDLSCGSTNQPINCDKELAFETTRCRKH